MNFFKTFKTYLNAEEKTSKLGRKSDSFELIVSDILPPLE